jgi:hypothetical protein
MIEVFRLNSKGSKGLYLASFFVLSRLQKALCYILWVMLLALLMT